MFSLPVNDFRWLWLVKLLAAALRMISAGLFYIFFRILRLIKSLHPFNFSLTIVLYNFCIETIVKGKSTGGTGKSMDIQV